MRVYRIAPKAKGGVGSEHENHCWRKYAKLPEKPGHSPVSGEKSPTNSADEAGFYSKGVIYPLVPKILASYEEVEMHRDAYLGELGSLVNRLLEEDLRQEGKKFKVILLSAPEAPETLALPGPIRNDKRSKTGKPTAFTMGQRYVSSEALWAAKTTSDLD